MNIFHKWIPENLREYYGTASRWKHVFWRIFRKNDENRSQENDNQNISRGGQIIAPKPESGISFGFHLRSYISYITVVG